MNTKLFIPLHGILIENHHSDDEEIEPELAGELIVLYDSGVEHRFEATNSYLGKGDEGHVVKIYCQKTKKFYACKMFHKNTNNVETF